MSDLKVSTRMHWVHGERSFYGWEQRPKSYQFKRCFTAHFWFVGWDCISLGVHVAIMLPNIEVHLPFGFVRIGWVKRQLPLSRWHQ